ncbi:MAG: hypothetical protein PHT02_00855 [Tissierellia bacterium]|nr:hypothetical protein [Tissierellia bacterium]
MKSDYMGIPLKWYQKLYLCLLDKLYSNEFISYCLTFPNRNLLIGRGTSKTGLEFARMLERLKNKAKTPEEKAYYEQLQKEWGETCKGITLGYWS